MSQSRYEEFREYYGVCADAEFKTYCSLPVQTLLDQVKAGQYGKYYQLWKALEKKATLQQAGWLLFDVLKSSADYLNRYHCATTLITLAGGLLSEFQPVMLSANTRPDGLRQDLDKTESLLLTHLGKGD